MPTSMVQPTFRSKRQLRCLFEL